ncbi:MAG: DUF4899 domain-containing protein [Spirochaetia bacterium]|nr:DUF4899 domain-containing protein [Spirochaetia bacterium]
MEDRNLKNDWTIVKGKLFTPKQNFYGLMIIFYDNNRNVVDNVNLVFSMYSETHDIELTDSWIKFEKTIQDMIFGANFSQSFTMTAIDKLKADTNSNLFASELKTSLNKQDITAINTLFKHIFSKIINDEKIVIDCAFEEISHKELIDGRIREDVNTIENDDFSESISTPPDYKLINAKLILAPIDGKLITELNVGDSIMVNLIIMSMAENAVIDKLKLRKPDGSAKPVPAKIVKIQPYAKGFQLLVNITENYYAKIIEEERILVKTVNSPLVKDKGKLTDKKNKNNDNEKSGISWIMIGTVVVLGIAIIYFVFIGG